MPQPAPDTDVLTLATVAKAVQRQLHRLPAPDAALVPAASVSAMISVPFYGGHDIVAACRRLASTLRELYAFTSYVELSADVPGAKAAMLVYADDGLIVRVVEHYASPPLFRLDVCVE